MRTRITARKHRGAFLHFWAKILRAHVNRSSTRLVKQSSSIFSTPHEGNTMKNVLIASLLLATAVAVSAQGAPAAAAQTGDASPAVAASAVAKHKAKHAAKKAAKASKAASAASM
jgi:hypothetical protein